MQRRRTFVTKSFFLLAFFMHDIGKLSGLVPFLKYKKVTGSGKRKLVRVIYRLHFPSESNQQWHSDRQQWDAPDAIKKLISEFQNKGYIINFKEVAGNGYVSWIYLFNSKRRLNEWNELIYKEKLFRVGEIRDGYKFSYQEEYLT